MLVISQLSLTILMLQLQKNSGKFTITAATKGTSEITVKATAKGGSEKVVKLSVEVTESED
ncbi:hypothetical protein [Campylobacter phage CP21]|uniref:Uncharacterized protein n=1 Tax=Campylobacter phage CP21 TaxID=2881391 RepID=I7KIN7_9CAUD|nr:hypothetical protein F421_gp174 [Campylobacter phage CP21]CCH63636.1 hypothetical protein [Campylobacter phage CP21]